MSQYFLNKSNHVKIGVSLLVTGIVAESSKWFINFHRH